MVDVADVAEEQDDGGEDDEGEEGGVVQRAVEGAGFLAVGGFVGGGVALG